MPVCLPDPLELVVEQVARHGVERAERLVHEQDVGLLRERPRQRPRAGACRPRARAAACRRSRQVDQVEQLGARAALVARPARPPSAARSSTLAAAVSHGKSAASWNSSAGPAIDETSPRVGVSSPAIRLSSVVLPQPEAPTTQRTRRRRAADPTRSASGAAVRTPWRPRRGRPIRRPAAGHRRAHRSAPWGAGRSGGAPRRAWWARRVPLSRSRRQGRSPGLPAAGPR